MPGACCYNEHNAWSNIMHINGGEVKEGILHCDENAMSVKVTWLLLAKSNKSKLSNYDYWYIIA